MIKLLRKESDTPSIQNSDDARAFIYAFGNQNGYVKDYKEEVKVTTLDRGLVRVSSGEIVIQGWQIELDSEGETVDFGVQGSNRYCLVVLKLDLLKETVELQGFYGTSDYPDVPESDNLVSNPDGVAYISIAKFILTANSSAYLYLNKLIKPVEFVQDLKVKSAEVATFADQSGVADLATMAQRLQTRSWNHAKGTIELYPNRTYQLCLYADYEGKKIVGTLPLLSTFENCKHYYFPEVKFKYTTSLSVDAINLRVEFNAISENTFRIDAYFVYGGDEAPTEPTIRYRELNI